MKVCSTCKVQKPLDCFYLRSETGRVRSRCKACCQEVRLGKRDKKAEYDAKRYASNSEQIIARVQEYASTRKEEKKAYDQAISHKRLERLRERYRTDPEYRVKCLLRNRLSAALHGRARAAKTLELLGCSPAFLLEYLESKFEVGMTRELLQAGAIHIDHVIPCAAFNLMRAEDQKVCFHYSNLKPMWAKENNKKRCRVAQSEVRTGSYLARKPGFQSE